LEQLRHTDRLTTSAPRRGVAHELDAAQRDRRPSRPILATEGVRGPTGEYARIIQEQASRMTGVIRQLLDFSRRQGPKLAVCNLRMLAGRTAELLRPLAARRHATVEVVTTGGEPFARVDQNQMQQALANVMMNGIEAMPRGGRLLVSIEPCMARRPDDAAQVAAGPRLRITIEDEGEGIAAQDLPHIFEPFFTTKGVGEGTGLGLSVAHGIVADHGGWIDVQSEVGKGTRMTIYLGAAEPGTAEVAS
jgi:signal transduction histidine kinase